jgi:hypothetical protein
VGQSPVSVAQPSILIVVRLNIGRLQLRYIRLNRGRQALSRFAGSDFKTCFALANQYVLHRMYHGEKAIEETLNWCVFNSP